MSQSVIGALRVNLGLDAAQFERGARRARKPAQDLARTMRGVAAAAAMGAAMSLAVRSGLADVDRVAKAARSIDGTSSAFRALEIAANDAGVSQGALMTAMQHLNREIARAAEEGGRGAAALRRLGLDAAKLSDLDADERLARIADAVREAGLSSGQTANLLRDLGVRSQEMALLLGQGGGAIRAARREVQDLGLALSEDAVAQIERTNDALARIGMAMQALRNRIAAAVAPALEVLAEGFRRIARAVVYTGETMGILRQVGLEVASRLAMGFAGLGQLLTAAARGMQASFITAFANIARGFADLVAFISGPFNALMEATGRDIRITLGQGIAGALEETRDAALMAAASSRDAGRATLRAANAPLIALGVLRQHLVGTAADTDEWRATLGALGDELESVGGAGGSAARAAQGTDALRQSLNQAHAAGQQLEAGMANAFASIVSGSQKARQAIAGLLQEMSRMLAHQAFTSLFGSLFGGATQISGPAMPRGASFAPPPRPSFEGGGFTGFGARVGGVDGRGGFPAILHPNETVIDHTKGGGDSQTVVRVELSPDLEARVLGQALGQSVEVVRQYDRSSLPARVGQINRDPRRRG